MAPPTDEHSSRLTAVTEEPPDSREVGKFIREVDGLLAEGGVDVVLDLDGLLTVCDLTMDDLQVVGQQVNFPPARMDSSGPAWSFVEVELWLGPVY